jgi:hypothetical protein
LHAAGIRLTALLSIFDTSVDEVLAITKGDARLFGHARGVLVRGAGKGAGAITFPARAASARFRDQKFGDREHDARVAAIGGPVRGEVVVHADGGNSKLSKLLEDPLATGIIQPGR